MTRSPAIPGGTLVLDSEGLAKAVLRDRTVTGPVTILTSDPEDLTADPEGLTALCGGRATVIKT